ncbi:purple acid phosphatase family protein [Konateibacter massiliensis]|uniref:purple acid phosphatase family protein n=1 Tax=Konateibacter massiliensis TaxID=2002841 RepID=UPI000C14FD99|nr:metallophosphoesterase family protein [Konateibacter massiliensis]
MKRIGLTAILLCFLLTFMVGCSQKADDVNIEQPVEQAKEQTTEENTSVEEQAEATVQKPAAEAEVPAAEETLAVGSGEIITVPAVANEVVEKTGLKYLSVEVGKTEAERNFVWYSKSASDGMVLMQEASTMESNLFYTSNSTAAKTKESKTEEGYYVNKATVSNLKPSTTYYYVVGNSEGWSPIYTYKTSSFDTSFSFAAVGDPEMGIGTDDEGLDQMGIFDNTINKIKEQIQDVAFLLSTGDQVGINDSNDDYASLLNHVGLYSLAFAPTIGNHDVGGSHFKEHFNLPNFNKIEPDADVTNDDYYFSYNGVLFLMINSNNGSDYDDYHKKFVEEASAQYPDATWKVAVFHFPPFSAVEKNQNDAASVQELIPFLEEAGVDVVLNGHDQLFSRTHVMKGTSISQKTDGSSVTNPDGIVYFTLSSSSGNLFHESIGNPNAVKTEASGHPQASRIDVTPTSFKVTTYNTDTWEVYDEFSIIKE